MRKRIGLVLGLLILRLLTSWVSTLEYKNDEKLKITGKVVNIAQSASDCVIKIGIWEMKMEGKCSVSAGDEVSAIGSVGSSLIDRLFGRLLLVNQDELQVVKRQLPVKNMSQSLIEKIGEWRTRLVVSSQRQLPEPESGLVLGVVYGIKTGLDKKFYDELVKSGTVHMVVASGYNVSVVAETVLVGLLVFMKRKWASITSILAIVLYGVIASGEPPVVRAVVMASVVITGQAIGRRSGSLWSLFLAGAVMLFLEPVLIRSASFQLSMAASLAVLWLSPIIEKWVANVGYVGISKSIIINSELVTTFSALVMTGPIIWWHFGRLSPVSLISNTLILPLVPTLMGAGGIATLVGVLSSEIARPLYWLVFGLAHVIVELVRIFGQ